MAESDECYTPAEWIQRARDVMGSIDTDPTSNDQANLVVRARRYYTIERSGLRKNVRWRGNVWFQPPYSKPLPFVERLIAEYEAGHCTQAIALLNARPGSVWFQLLARIAWRCEKRKRIKFYGPGSVLKKKKKKRAKRKTDEGGGSGFQDNVFFYLGTNPKRFAAVFADVGEVVPPSVTISVTERGRCKVCKRSLEGHRRGAITCTPRCRQAHRRALLASQSEVR